MTAHFLNELRHTFTECARQPALIYQDRSYTFADLESMVIRGAAYLQHHGLASGDRVALWIPTKFPFLVAYLSVLYAGGVALPLNPKFTSEEMRYFLADSSAGLAIGGPEQLASLEALRPTLQDLQGIIPDADMMQASAGCWREVVPAAEEPCLLIYSSGTTGWPKGVVHTHANLASSLRALARCWRFTPEDIVVNVLPLFHIHGLSFATQLPLLTGGCVLIEDTFHPQQTLEVIGRGTVFMAVPTIYYRFLQEPNFPEAARSWHKVRLFTCGSAPIRPEVLPQLEEILGQPVINRYGMTEAHVITSLPLDGPWPQGSVGLPLEGIELQVIGPEGAPVPPGEVGSVMVRGPNLFREYWRQPEATREAFVSLPPTLSSKREDGVKGDWFRTGDLGFLDTRGFLTLVGRSNDLIITNGYNVYPQVVERVINGCPGVRESAVLGVPDEIHGERVVAVVVREDPQLDEQRLRAWWNARLVDYQRPREVLFTEALPRNAMGKVLLTELRQRLRRTV